MPIRTSLAATVTALVLLGMTGCAVTRGQETFGGQGLSGTGPKAGGPHYLARFCTEQTVSVNTTAAGGNAALLGRVR